MEKLAGGLPYDPLPLASSSSSDAGIREDNNVNLVSSSTLNDRGMSLPSFPVESDIFMEKSPLYIQTFVNVSCEGCVRRDMGVENFSMEIRGCCKRGGFVVELFRFEILPVEKMLSSYSTVTSDIPSEEIYLESTGTDPIERKISLRIENVLALNIKNSSIMSSETYHHEILPINKHLVSSENLKKLEQQMMSLQNVFQKVKVSRELKSIKETNNLGFVEIKQVIENSGTQTPHSRAQNTDFSCEKIECLTLECEFVRAAVYMIKRYPFYFEFLKRCYSERNFDQHKKFEHLKPKQKSFELAVVEVCGYDETYLKAINSALLEYDEDEFEESTCLCIE